MPRRLPERLPRRERRRDTRSCAAHRAWVRQHRCSVPQCQNLPIECAHVRSGTDGGQGLKPSDRWCISLCQRHHHEQHRVGERAFEVRHGICLVDLARAFAARSPHWRRLQEIHTQPQGQVRCGF